jgi:predicted nucleotidyltransferase
MHLENLSPEDQAAVILLLKPLDPAVIYLFGSAATDRMHPSSDLDIAFLPGSNLDPVRCFELANHLSDQLKRQVDLVDLSRSNPVTAKEVLRTGKPIHIGGNLRRQEFEMRVLSDYARLNEERHAVLPR